MGVECCCVDAKTEPKKQIKLDEYVPVGTISIDAQELHRFKSVSIKPPPLRRKNVQSFPVSRDNSAASRNQHSTRARRAMPLTVATNDIMKDKKRLDHAYRDGICSHARAIEESKHDPSHIPDHLF